MNITIIYKLHTCYTVLKVFYASKHCFAWFGVGNGKFKLIESSSILRSLCKQVWFEILFSDIMYVSSEKI
jgi:hypothetical protein